MSKKTLLIIKLISSLFGVCFGLMIIIGLPFSIVFSLNTLFPTMNIPYNFNTWISAFMLWAMFGRIPSDWTASKQRDQSKRDNDDVDIETT